jgi:UDP-N-acetylmuramoyl-tripeptide--D-alanyl-D-alanine ligase
MYWFFGSFIPWSAFLFLKFKKVLHMYQQNLYNDNHRYTKWLIKNYKKVLFDIDFLAFILFSIISIFIGGYPLMIIFVVMYIMLSYFYYQRLANEKAKKPLVITARARRLIITTFIINIVPIASISLVFTMSQLDYYYLYTNLLTYLLYLTIYLVNGINFPIERGYYFYFKYQAKKKLKSMPNLKVIGITGSYGKTTSKNILSDVLSIKFNTLPTPRSLNTPNGLMITINNHLDKFDEIFNSRNGGISS